MLIKGIWPPKFAREKYTIGAHGFSLPTQVQEWDSLAWNVDIKERHRWFSLIYWWFYVIGDDISVIM